MGKTCLFLAFALGLGLALALLWMAGASSSPATAAPRAEGVEALNAPAAELHVCPSACPYSSIQAAVDAASPGDVVKIATGVYTDIHSRPAPPGYPYPWPAPTDVVTQVVYISKTITIRGGYTAPDFAEPPSPEQNPTTLDAQHQGHVIFVTGNADPTIEGLRITGGGLERHVCRIEPGGGVYAGSTAATIRDNQIFGNRGVGVFAEHGTIIVSRNLIADNEACDGGGLQVSDSIATVSDNLISSNWAASSGGGIWVSGGDATLINNTITDNRAYSGGGVNIFKGDATLINNVIVDNHGEYDGGALALNGGSHRLLHSTIARNTAGDGSAVAAHTAEGIYSSVSLSNTILVNHSVGITITGGSTMTVNSVLWYAAPITVSQSPTATVTVQNQYTGDPAFATDGYHIMAGSAAIDKGVDAGVTDDIDGEARPAGTGYDLGADELWFRIYLPLVLRNR